MLVMEPVLDVPKRIIEGELKHSAAQELLKKLRQRSQNPISNLFQTIQYGIDTLQEHQKALELIFHIYLRAHLHLYINNHSGLHSLITSWYSSLIGNREQAQNFLCTYPTTQYPEVCMCGTTYSESGSYLRYHCPNCKGVGNILTRYDFNIIARILEDTCPISQAVSITRLESIAALVLYSIHEVSHNGSQA